jgi:hypothetical protein
MSVKSWWIYLNQKANRWQCKVFPHHYPDGQMIENQIEVVSKQDYDELKAKYQELRFQLEQNETN